MPFPVACIAAATQRRKGQNAAIYLLRDEFTTDDAAPLASPRTCEPGPGTLTAVQTDGQLSISSGALAFPAQTTANFGDLGFTTGGLARAIGRALSVNARYSTVPGAGQYSHMLMWANTVPVTAAGHRSHWMLVTGGSPTIWLGDASDVLTGQAIAVNTTYQLGIVMRSAGAWFLAKGGSLAEWTLLWASVTANTATVYPAFQNRHGVGTLDSLRAFDLAAPWATDYGIATQQLAGARAPGDTFTHEANALIEFTVGTVPAALQIELRFRVQDATNYWQVTVDSTGALDLDEVVAGVVTQRGTAAGVVANGDRIVIVADGTTIRVYEANTIRITYAAAANFQTETDGELETEGTGGAVTDIVSWPRTLSSAALTELEKYTA